VRSLLALPIRRPRATLALWALLTTALVVIGLGTPDRLGQPDLVADGSPSARALDLVRDRQGPSSTVAVVLRGADLETAGPAVATALRARPGVTVVSPFDPGGPSQLRPRPGAAMLLAIVAGDGRRDRPDADADAAHLVRRTVRAATPAGVQAHLSGTAVIYDQLKESSEEAALRGEIVALPVLLVVLLLVFRTPISALVPAVFGGLGVAAGMGVLWFAAGLTDLTVFAATLTSMMGLALGVDYVLLLVSRHREERAAGASVQDAAATALRSAGGTVVLAAVALTAAMVASILLTDGDLLLSPALGVLAATLVSVVAALTAIPALLVLLDGPLERRPVVTSLVVLVPLVALAIPGVTLDTGPGDVRQLPADTGARQDFDVLTKELGPGWAGPFELVGVDAGEPGRAAVARVAARAAADPGVAAVLPGPRTAVVPRSAPNDEETAALHARLRALAGEEVLVGGVAAELAEFDDDTHDQLVPLVLGLAAVTFLVLVLLLRAPLLALISVALNLLTVAVAFGAVVLLFQGEDPVLGGPGYLEIVSMVSMFTVMVGLSIDYQVFLLHRMREGLDATGDPEAAIAHGLDRTARVVTGAAAIMVGVFLAFATTEVATVKQFGIGLAVAIAIDATAIRLVLLPAAMRLGGRATWWPVAGARGRGDVSAVAATARARG